MRFNTSTLQKKIKQLLKIFFYFLSQKNNLQNDRSIYELFSNCFAKIILSLKYRH